ncbi:MAG: hypothetical protein HY788_02280 [Deltaproteobacteria bacterium]|nr:hypothetical protein [Deltaproteobacteria bacterium]
MKKSVLLVAMLMLLPAGTSFGLEKGAILYHTGSGGTLYGARDVLELPCSALQLVIEDLGSGHAGLYIGDNRVIHAVQTGIEEVDAVRFLSEEELADGYQVLGAKVPVTYNDPAVWPQERKDQILLIAKEQVGKNYDLTFHRQTGPGSGDFTCVGLVEFVYEKVDYRITPVDFYDGGDGGKTYTQTYNCSSTLFLDWLGVNTFANNVQFSKFSHPLDFCCGRENDGKKHIFFPYTQFLQNTTVEVEVDVPISGGEKSGRGEGSGGCFIDTVRTF